MTAVATTAWPAAERSTLRVRPPWAATWTAAQISIIGGRKGAENLATHARPKRPALRMNGPAPGRFRWRHHAPREASMKNAIQTSDVARPPWASSVGLNVKKVRETRPPAVPKSALDQKKTSAPRATLRSAVMARAAMSLGKWSSPVS